MTKNKVAIVVANYYKDYTERLLKGSTAVLDGEYDYEVFSVPGAWDTVYKVNSLVDSYNKFIVINQSFCRVREYEYPQYSILSTDKVLVLVATVECISVRRST